MKLLVSTSNFMASLLSSGIRTASAYTYGYNGH
jgi:hypothetical protein